MPESQISISEDKLYRALAEQELRILNGVEEKLEKKIKPIESRVTVLELKDAGENALAGDLIKRQDRAAMLRPTLFATVISVLAGVLLHFLP